MGRATIWKGESRMAGLVARRIAIWDAEGEVAKRLDLEESDDGEVAVVATFGTKGDEDDAIAYADGYVDGFTDAEEGVDEDEDDEGEDEEDEDGEDD